MKRRFVRLFSLTFWASVTHNKCHEFFGSFVKKKTIVMHVFYQVLIASATVVCYWYYGVPISGLSPIPGWNSRRYFICVSILSICIGLLGMLATCRRSVRLMKVYLFLGPVYAFCGLLCTAPFLVMSCECDSHDQCSLLLALKPGEINNQFPEAHLLLIDPPPIHFGQKTPTSEQRFQADDLPATVVKYEGDAEVPADEDPEKEDDFSEVEFLGWTRKGWENFENILNQQCSCAGEVFFLHEQNERESCRWYKAEDGEIRSWCQVDDGAVPSCKKKNIRLHEIPDSWARQNEIELDVGKYGTEDICHRTRSKTGKTMKVGKHSETCACSTRPMSTARLHSGDLNPVAFGNHSSLLQYGDRCEKWLKRDEKPWCFVGFDSPCADRQPVNVQPIEDEFKTLAEVSQYTSSIPCTDHIYEAAGYWCTFLKVIYLLLQAPLAFGILPMYVIIYLFLRNHCGDLVAIKAEFAVEFSDDDSEDDFVVKDSTREQLPRPPKVHSAAPEFFASFTKGDDSDVSQTGRSAANGEIEMGEYVPPVVR